MEQQLISQHQAASAQLQLCVIRGKTSWPRLAACVWMLLLQILLRVCGRGCRRARQHLCGQPVMHIYDIARAQRSSAASIYMGTSAKNQDCSTRKQSRCFIYQFFIYHTIPLQNNQDFPHLPVFTGKSETLGSGSAQAQAQLAQLRFRLSAAELAYEANTIFPNAKLTRMFKISHLSP